jgi:predicted nuclease with TOPRIM domain
MLRLFTDILKSLPENAVLRDKVAEAEKRYTEIESENVTLKDDLRHAKAEITKLKRQVEELTHKDRSALNEFDIKILQVIAIYTNAPAEVITQELNDHYEKVKLCLNNLSKRGYVRGQDTIEGFFNYRLCDKARVFLIDNNLLPPPTPY